MKTKTSKVLAERQNEWTTDLVFQSGQSFFMGRRNGGTRGAYQPADQVHGDWGFWHQGPTQISKDEALAKCAAMGVEEVDIQD